MSIFNSLEQLQKIDVKGVSPITMAFLGDAVHTLLVRSWFLNNHIQKVGNLHTFSSKICSAKGQARAFDLVFDILTEEEKEISRRARNAKTHKPPKNCDLEVYKKATSYEALLGNLLVKQDYQRIEFLFLKFMEKELLVC